MLVILPPNLAADYVARSHAVETDEVIFAATTIILLEMENGSIWNTLFRYPQQKSKRIRAVYLIINLLLIFPGFEKRGFADEL